jgi:hypothetical protein
MVIQIPEALPFGAAVLCTVLLLAAVLQNLWAPWDGSQTS